MAAENGSESTGRIGLSWVRRPTWVLLALIGVYIAISVWLSVLRYEEFATSNWDLGIFQQALWSSTHGHPMYEAGDWESFGSRSLLQVHPAFSLFLLVPFYALAPSAYTLFVIQSVVAGAAALPLYAIGHRVIGRPWPAVILAGFYLVAAPVLVANLYDFHLEAFLPLEITLLFYLWLTGRYYWGLLVAAIALMTIEVVPFLIAALAVYFMWPALRESLRELRRSNPARSGHGTSATRRLVETLRHRFAERETRWSVILLLVAVVSYVLLRAVEWYVLPGTLPPAPNAASGIGLIPGKATDLGLSLSWAFTTNLRSKVIFWVLMAGVFGFLPLMAPRVLVLQVPWFVFTVQSPLLTWTTLGFQYTFVAVIPMAIAAIYGYPRAERLVSAVWVRLRSRWSARRGIALGPVSAAPWSAPRLGSRVHRRSLLAGLVIAVVVANLLIGPLNPMNQTRAGPLPGYVVEYTPPPGFQNVVKAAELVPPTAYVLASSNLFPLVADDVNAYALLWTPNQPNQLPFGFDHPPQYAFLATNQLFAVPPWFTGDMHRGEFGLRAVVWVAPTGSVFLYELGYTGPTDVIGPV